MAAKAVSGIAKTDTVTSITTATNRTRRFIDRWRTTFSYPVHRIGPMRCPGPGAISRKATQRLARWVCPNMEAEDERKLAQPALPNARDLGGLPTKGGSTRLEASDG